MREKNGASELIGEREREREKQEQEKKSVMNS